MQEAKARFSEFLDCALKNGPQVVTRRGIEEAVLIPIEQWRRMEKLAAPGLKSLLLCPQARFDDLIVPPRGLFKRRRPANLK